MKLKRCHAEQFAGIQNLDICFTDGMNVVLGNNETGKSTMISAMFHALTTPSKISRNRKDSKEFMAQYFPAQGGNAIDVTLELSESGRQYIIEKIWDKENTNALSKVQQDGTIWRGTAAEAQLQALLRYGPAVYSNLVFGRQNHADEILSWCYDFFSNTENEDIAAVRRDLSGAFSAAGGIPEEKFQAVLQAQMDALASRWDFAQNRPEKDRGIDHPWLTKTGIILNAYYAYQKAQRELQEAEQAEQELSRLAGRLAELEQQKVAWEQQQELLLKQHGMVTERENIQRLLRHAQQELEQIRTMQSDWPNRQKTLHTAQELLKQQKELQKRREKAALEQKIQSATALQTEINTLRRLTEERSSLPNDSRTAQKLSLQLKEQEARLHAVRLRASVRLENGQQATLRQPDGSVQLLSGHEEITTHAFVHVQVPGVADLLVAPQDMDIDGLQQSIQEARESLTKLLSVYQAATPEELSALAADWHKQVSEQEVRETELRCLLGDETIAALEQQAAALLPDESILLPEEPEKLEEEIRQFLRQSGRKNLEASVAADETTLLQYSSTDTSPEALAVRCGECEEVVRTYSKKLEECKTVLSEAEYTSQLNALKENLADLDRQRQTFQQQCAVLSAKESADLSELQDQMERSRQNWALALRKYQQYQRIAADFERLRRETTDRFRVFYDSFNENLAALAGHNLSMYIQDNHLALQSGRNPIPTKELLSEGTRKTVLLAFRLAVLQYFFPKGDGLIVLDDDLLDLDTIRRGRASTLLQHFAEQNQIIFTTCDPAIASLLGGNCIRL